MTERLDVAMVRLGLARSRSRAKSLIEAGSVTVNRTLETRPAAPVVGGDRIELSDPDRFVSRAAHKLVSALAESHTRVPPRVLDAGASTGGFTQVLLEAGAERVYAVDVGHGQLAGEIRGDPRVVVWEGVNLRSLTLGHVEGHPVDLLVADVSFISLRLLIEPLLGVLRPCGEALLLVKPQFEVGRRGLDSRGVVRDEFARRAAVDAVAAAARERGRQESWRGMSRLPGESGNVEYFLKLAPVDGPVGVAD